jgi:hypothetical protein
MSGRSVKNYVDPNVYKNPRPAQTPGPKTTVTKKTDKKATTTVIKKIPTRKFNPITKHLYYTDSCEYCLELIRILSKVPKLGNCIDCFSIDDYDIQGITGVPAIDDMESDRPWELEESFMWVIDQCNLIVLEDDELVRKKKMRPEDALTKVTIAQIEIDIKRVFDKVNAYKKKTLKPGALSRTGTEQNPLEKFRTLGGTEDFAPAVYEGVHSQELWKKFKLQYEAKKKKLGSIDSRVARREKERESIMEQAKQKWIEEGIIDPQTGLPYALRRPVKREDLRTKSVTDMDIRKLISEREKDIAMLRARTGGHSTLIKPQERSALKIGTAITERDIAAYQQQRSTHLDGLQRTPMRRY